VFTASRCTGHAPTCCSCRTLDVMRSDGAGESWHEISGNLPSDFGFPIEVHAHEPTPSMWFRSRVTRSTTRPRASCACIAAAPAKRMGAADQGLPAEQLLRQRVARRDGRDSLDSCGVYFGTTGGRCMRRPTPGTTGHPSPEPSAVLSVEVQTLPDPGRCCRHICGRSRTSTARWR